LERRESEKEEVGAWPHFKKLVVTGGDPSLLATKESALIWEGKKGALGNPRNGLYSQRGVKPTYDRLGL